MELSDFFSPLTPQLILFTVLAFLFLDVLGSFFDRFIIKSPLFLRPVLWLYGLGIFVLTWFLLHFFLPFSGRLIVISTLPFIFVALPSYLRARSWQTLIQFIRNHPWLVVVFIILAPALWIKASLPPYLTDEVRYHFLSPYEIINEQSWWFFNSDLYTHLPKSLDLSFWLPFAISKTYAPSRLLHFLLFFSTFSAIYAWLKSRFSKTIANTFLFIFPFLLTDLLIIGTSGYTDYSLAGLTALGVVLLLESVWSGKLILASAVIWGLALGTKYTALISLTLFSLVTFIFSLKAKKPITLSSPHRLLSFGFLLIIFGGFWYLKNFIYTSDPIYPFLAKIVGCRLPTCFDYSPNFFQGWTIPVTFANLPKIAWELTAHHRLLIVLLLLSPILIFRQGTRNLKYAYAFIVSGLVLELIIAHFVSGFLTRYFVYFIPLLTILVCLPATSHRLYRYLVISFALFNFAQTMKITYGVWHNFSPQEAYYAFHIGGTDIRTWVKDRLPENKDLVYWCGEPGDKTLYVLDEGIWHPKSNEQIFSIFNVNCQFAGVPNGKTYLDLQNDGITLMLASTRTCQDSSSANNPQEKLRNQLICTSKTVGKNLFLFEPFSE